MGKILQIRVTATTYNEDDVKKAYPFLFSLAWPENDRYIPASQKYGLIELAETLSEAVNYANWEEITRVTLKDGIQTAHAICKKLQAALTDWQAREAEKISFELEDAMALLEQNAQEKQLPKLQQ